MMYKMRFENKKGLRYSMYGKDKVEVDRIVNREKMKRASWVGIMGVSKIPKMRR